MIKRTLLLIPLAVVLGTTLPHHAIADGCAYGRITAIGQNSISIFDRETVTFTVDRETRYTKWITRGPWQQNIQYDARLLDIGRLVAIHPWHDGSENVARWVQVATDVPYPYVDIDVPRYDNDVRHINDVRRPDVDVKKQHDVDVKRPDNDVKRPDIDVKKQHDNDVKKQDIDVKRPDNDVKRPDIDVKKQHDIDVKRPDNDVKRPDNDVVKKQDIDVKRPDNDVKRPDNDVKRPDNDVKKYDNDAQHKH